MKGYKMKLVELNGDEFLASISSLAERGYDALFSYKLNRHNRVIYYAIYFEGEVYYLDARDEDKLDPFLTSFTITDKLIRCNNIYLFDYKKLIKANKNFSRKEMIYKVQDVKMQLFNILGKESEFNSDHIKKITDIDYNFPISDFLQKNSGLKEDCCEIFPKKEIEDIAKSYFFLEFHNFINIRTIQTAKNIILCIRPIGNVKKIDLGNSRKIISIKPV